MVQQVIDLISSSPLPPPKTHCPVPQATTATNIRKPQPTSQVHHGVDLDYLSDEFDTSIDIDELISLPSLNDRASAPANENVRTKTPLSGRIETAEEVRKRIIQEAVVDIDSEDFNTTFEIDGLQRYESSGNKRRRVSNSADLDVAPPLDTFDPFYSPQKEPQADPNSRHDSLPRGRAIEIRSSPERPHAARIKSTLPPSAHRDTNPIPHGASFQSSQDPFKSPTMESIPCSNPPAPRATGHFESSDPFASSPPARSGGQTAAPQYARRSPDLEILSGGLSPPSRTSKPMSRQNWDPISSSAPEITSSTLPEPRRQRTTSEVAITVDSDSSVAGSESGLDDLPDFDKLKAAPRKRSAFQRSHSDNFALKSRSRAAKPAKSNAEKTRERETKAAATAAEKERKKRERERDKEAKAREKDRAAALAEVNKMRTDKKISTPEMLVDLSASLNPTIKTQVEPLLKALDVEFSTWESPVSNVIKWRRKVTSRFNEDLGYWEPIPRRIEPERHVAVVLLADEFVQLALSGELDDHVSKMEEHFPNQQYIYLIEGLHVWMRKNRNLRNRQFTSGVRVQEEGAVPSRGRRRNAPAAEYVSEETIEDALLQLQVMHDALIHHTRIPLETSQWIVVLTQHISTIPYRKQKDLATMNAAFCMESGQVRSGDDAKDTFIRMLQEISRVTAPVAYGVAAEFRTVTELVNGLEAGGPNRLEAIKKSANKDGVVSDRVVGPALSKRLHKVFTGRDESSTDV